MTAEVLVINANAVALAADSAVTIGFGKKIYNSAIKVFSLSKHEPVGVMIYGNADIMGVPWEIVIKMFRQFIGINSHDKLEQYGEILINFLHDNANIFTDKIKRTWFHNNVMAYFIGIASEIAEIMSEREAGGDGHNNSIDNPLEQVAEERLQQVLTQDFIEGFDEKSINEIKSYYSDELEKAYCSVFNDKLSSENKSRLIDLAAEVHARRIFSNGHTGIVVCGYGNLDIFPVAATYNIDGIVLDRVRYSKNKVKSHRMEHGNDCAIIPLAQEDMMASFMEGINPLVKAYIDDKLSNLRNTLPSMAENCFSSNTGTNAFTKHLSEEVDLLQKDVEYYIREMHVKPIIDMVKVLPKEELAAMAESLVNLTAFKRRMSNELETVGGPIDVAVISKGDGFVWIKRKHYFDPDLNHQFFANYFSKGA